MKHTESHTLARPTKLPRFCEDTQSKLTQNIPAFCPYTVFKFQNVLKVVGMELMEVQGVQYSAKVKDQVFPPEAEFC